MSHASVLHLGQVQNKIAPGTGLVSFPNTHVSSSQVPCPVQHNPCPVQLANVPCADLSAETVVVHSKQPWRHTFPSSREGPQLEQDVWTTGHHLVFPMTERVRDKVSSYSWALGSRIDSSSRHPQRMKDSNFFCVRGAKTRRRNCAKWEGG